MRSIGFILNGVAQRADVAPGQSLLDVLRHDCHITSVHDGCAPQGQCCACLALVNVQPKTTCAVN
jgi:aerobic-type carbon monoxide dehydrogenase small subunit (CoxS/CutS family)